MQWIQEYGDGHRAWNVLEIATAKVAALTAEVAGIATAKLAANSAAKLATKLIERSNSAKSAMVLSSA